MRHQKFEYFENKGIADIERKIVSCFEGSREELDDYDIMSVITLNLKDLDMKNRGFSVRTQLKEGKESEFSSLKRSILKDNKIIFKETMKVTPISGKIYKNIKSNILNRKLTKSQADELISFLRKYLIDSASHFESDDIEVELFYNSALETES